MAEPIDHPEWNIVFGPSTGDEDRVGTIRCKVKFIPGTGRVASVTSAWRLSETEIQEIINSGVIMMNQLYGLAPHYITTPELMKEFILEHGADTPRS